MHSHTPPTAIVDRQLLAYNARDLEAYCVLFAPDSVISKLNTGEELARGIDAIRSYYAVRFTNPALRCELGQRIALGNFVIDHEHVSGVTAQAFEAIVIYEVRDSLIRSVQIIWP